MRKSKRIQLVLLTAALASCNQNMMPYQTILSPLTLGNREMDTTLAEKRILNYPPGYCDCTIQLLSQQDSISKFSSNGFIRMVSGTQAFTNPYRKNTFWKKDILIQAGGFGASMRYSGS